ncbi:MAG: tetraacyldisaccharide 4'-kinase [Alphaproteobacteria bacterium]
MKQRTPSFWYRPAESRAPLKERFLAPLSRLYMLGYRIHRLFVKPQKASTPVLCVGNLVAGGTGKTPAAICLVETLRKHGLARNPYFLVRGYGGAEIGPLLVDPAKHTAWDTGDEALLLARSAPTIVSPNRIIGAQMAADRGADIIIMDDGLQNPGIHKDIKLAVINGEMGFGNGKTLPAGPLRQPLAQGLQQVDAFILVGEDKRNALKLIPEGKTVLRATLKTSDHADISKKKTYLAFAGIGYPQKFFTFLQETVGLNLAEAVPFPDHYPYEESDLKMLHEKARALGAELLTTEKDFLRLPKIENITVHTLPVDMVWNDEDAVLRHFESALPRTRP